MTLALDQLNLTDILFARMPVGIALFDNTLHLQRCNPTWAEFIARYTLTPVDQVEPGRHLYELAPETESYFQPLIERVLAGETVRQDEFATESGGIRSYWDLVLTPLFAKEKEQGAVVGLLAVVSDATDRVTATHNLRQTVATLQEREELLEKHARERTRELQSLLEVANSAASTLELQPLLYDILDHLKKVVDYTGATFLALEGEELVVLAHNGPIAAEVAARLRFPLQNSASREVIDNRESAIIPDVRADRPLANLYRASTREELRENFEYVRSWLSVPLIVKDRVIGVLSLDHEQPHFYTPQHARLALAFAGQVATHIENARLYAETRHRADEIRTLFSVQQAITRRLDPDAVLQMIADQARRLTDTEMSAVYLCHGDELEISVVSGKVSKQILGYRFPLDISAAGVAIRQQRSIRIIDPDGQDRVFRTLVDRVGAHSFIVVPLIFGEEAIGTITVANKKTGLLSSEDERVLTMLASGAANALENARLFARLEQRTQEVEALYRADERLYSQLQLDEVLDTLVNVAVEIMQADKSALLVWDEEDERLVVRAQHGFRPATVRQMQFTPQEGMIGRATRGEFVFVEDVRQQEEVATRITLPEDIQSFMHIPIETGGQLFGVFNVSYQNPRPFDGEARRLFIALAQRAALVVENARLYERAQEAAAAEERNRLARELHDAVTQTLFSASLIADVLPRIWERDEAHGRQRLQELRELTRGALAEMRTLLLELRPATLTEVSMNDLLRQLTEASIGRARLPIELEVGCQLELPPDVQVALYRIAQESLNNVIKHAKASRATVTLDCGAEDVRLLVTDNGRGFNTAEIRHDTLGLHIMRERAEKIGAELSINSDLGLGTRIEVVWQPDFSNK